MIRFLGGFLALCWSLAASNPLWAADYPLATRHVRYAVSGIYIDRGPNPYCGPRCGCPIPVYVKHRSLVRFYPSGFDPRTKEDVPYFSYGPVQTYVRFADPKDPDRVLTY